MNSLRLFDSDSEEFLTNGKGNLTKYAIKPIVHNEVNGEYTLEFDYPCLAPHYNDILNRDIIVTKVDPYSKPQAFRVLHKTTPIDGNVTFLANHISYDLSGKILKAPPLPQASTPDVPGNFSSCKNAFSYMSNKNNVIGDLGKFTFKTDIENSSRLDMPTPMSIRSFLGSSSENSIISFYGGELYFDNFTVHHMVQIGTDSGVVVRYGKNMTDFNQVSDSSGVATGVYPYYYQENDGFIDGDVQYVLDDNGNKAFSYDKIMTLDCSSINWEDEGYSGYTGMPTKAMLNAYAKKYVKENAIGINKESTTISFKELAKVSGGESIIHDLEKVHLGDWVTVLYPNVNISLKAECVATDYNAATDTYESLTLGDPMETLSGSMVDNFFSVSYTTSTAIKQQASGTISNLDNKVDKTLVINSINNSPETELISDKRIDFSSSYTNTSVKGSAETTYRTGEVNITPENLGITVVNNTKDSVKKVAEATKATQDGDGNVITDTYLKKVDAPSSSGQEVYSEEITLKSSSWSSNTMTIAPSHVTATNTVIAKPHYGYEDAYSSAGIKVTEQGAKSLKLTCDTLPASDINVIIITIT